MISPAQLEMVLENGINPCDHAFGFECVQEEPEELFRAIGWL